MWDPMKKRGSVALSLKYGRIPIMVLGIDSPRSIHHGNVLIVYTYVYSDGKQVVCEVNKSVRMCYKHKYMMHGVINYDMRSGALRPLEHDEALEYLIRYVKSTRTGRYADRIKQAEQYDIVKRGPCHLTNHALNKGVNGYEQCPCTELFTVRETPSDAERLRRKYIRKPLRFEQSESD